MLALHWFVRSRSFGLAASAIALSVGAWTAPLFAAEAAVPRTAEAREKAAEALLEEALAAEVDGRGEDRAQLLAKAQALDPDLPAIQWHRGMVLVDGKWMSAEDVAGTSEGRALIEEYVAKRDAAEDSLPGHLAVAEWCREKNLASQERAHLTRILTFAPDDAYARARLGFVRAGDAWIGREEIARAVADEAKAQAALKKHAASLHDLVRWLGDENPGVRARAAERIRAIRDADAIPALERVVASAGEEPSLHVIEALSKMPEKEASLSLARFAVLAPDLKVRTEAAKRLKERSFDQFVPELLSSMTGPAQIQQTVARGRNGWLFLRDVSVVETMHSADVAVRDSAYFAAVAPEQAYSTAGLARDAAASAAEIAANRDAEARAALNQAFAKVREAERLDANARIAAVLETVSGETLGDQAQPWWNWWDQYNEAHVQGEKPVRTQYASQTIAVPVPTTNNRFVMGQIYRMSCFAAGTTVLTNRGDVAIEQVRLGDLVLGQEVETGELAFKPVLERTVRPPVEILRIEYDGGSLRSTGGHPFWVSGEGWVHARRLESGMELHTTNGTVRVSDVVSDGEEPAYNLIVADFANYFVGDARILSHDNSSRMPTDAIVPGLAQR